MNQKDEFQGVKECMYMCIQIKNAEMWRTLEVVMCSVVQNLVHTVASVCERFNVKTWFTHVNDISKN